MKKRLMAMSVALVVVASSFINVFAAASNSTANDKAAVLESTSEDVALKISLNKKNAEVKEGKSFKLKAKTNIEDAEVKFISTNKKVATVTKNGLVKTKNAGKVNIVAKCNGVKSVCKVKVNEVGNNISTSKMKEIKNKVGWQTQYKYYSSSIMCSAYSFAYAYNQVTGKNITAGSVWCGGGCTWDGGTKTNYSSAANMFKAIKSEIDNNKACVGLMSIRGGTHYVTFYSYTGKGTKLSDFTVVDPWDGKVKNASEFTHWSYQVVTINK